MLIFLSRTIVALALLGFVVAEPSSYHWPNPQLEYADGVLYAGETFLHALTQDCIQRMNTTVAAQWVRIAYHDMATHNIDDGTGGLDASIMFELDRAQNVGPGMKQSLIDFTFFTSPDLSFADIIAMATVMAVASCGGPHIPYRAGRIDAKTAGPATVPEPQQDLKSHTESFRRQGFTQSEMISLVACGHALGGVRQVDFPEIVPKGVEVANFASRVGFQNIVVQEYLSGSTANPLVSGANTTTNSDLRIFSSDRNETMKSLATGSNFNETCKALLERMINTVPKAVKLSTVVEPFEHKVSRVQLYPRNGAFRLNARLRFLRENPNRIVKMLWRDRTGSTCPTCFVQSQSSFTSTGTFMLEQRGLTFTTESFSTTSVNLNTSISQFWFEADEQDGKGPVKIDNGGEGYLVDDNLLFDAGRSNEFFPSEGDPFDTLVVAVKNATPSTKVSVTAFETGTGTSDPPFIPRTHTVDLVVDNSFPPQDGYTFYSNNFTLSVKSIDIKATVGAETYKLYVVSDEFRDFN